ncbi:MAG TPA: trypsin-like serine protease [Thermoanaerobaculia bacterium]
MTRRALSTATLALMLPLALAGALCAQAGPYDDELVRMGKSIPGFGGLFYDEEGIPNVYLLDPARVGPVVKSLGAGVRVRQADYEFAELVGWRLELRALLGLPGVVYLDVDEATNRVVLGVDATSRTKSLDRDRLEAELLFRNVPREAVEIRETGTFAEVLGVQDKFRPAPGGVQISFTGFLCTLGFNATRGNVFGFVTNSHCSLARGTDDGTRYYQSSQAGGAIGTKLADPEYITDSRCPAGRKCRFSDSAFVKYDKKNLGAVAKIVRPTNASSSLTVNPANARFTITKKNGGAASGQTVNKVGRSTGWSAGPVTATCADISSSVTEYTQFCQNVVRADTQGGDSGSPVFIRTNKNNITLVGILWAGGSDGAGNTIFAFSPLENIEMELGTLKVN